MSYHMLPKQATPHASLLIVCHSQAHQILAPLAAATAINEVREPIDATRQIHVPLQRQSRLQYTLRPHPAAYTCIAAGIAKGGASSMQTSLRASKPLHTKQTSSLLQTPPHNMPCEGIRTDVHKMDITISMVTNIPGRNS